MLGILSVHGHKDRDAFLLALSTLGLHSTLLQDSCLQQYFAITNGIPDAFTTNGPRRRSHSNSRWVSHQKYAETMQEEGPYNNCYLGARYSPDQRAHTLEIPYSTFPVLYHGPFEPESPFSYFTQIPQPPTLDNIYTSHPSPTLTSPFTEKEVTADITRRENIRILNTNVGGAYTYQELIWFMDTTEQTCAKTASETLIYSLQELGRKPTKEIIQIIRSRRALAEGTLLIPEHVIILHDHESDSIRPTPRCSQTTPEPSPPLTAGSPDPPALPLVYPLARDT